MLPLRIAFLWHFHQPYYEMDGEFILPWTRLHGVKDYMDMPALLHEFPDIKQTFNIVPSMDMQIRDYINGQAVDNVQRLSKLAPDKLDSVQKQELLNFFFLCNVENMIKHNKRYSELYDVYLSGQALQVYTAKEWLDLQVWYNLVWIGRLSAPDRILNRFFNKGHGFTVEERDMLLGLHIDILAGIKPSLSRLQSLSQIELSVTPLYHPILPLLCNTDSAQEARVDTKLPYRKFSRPEDAAFHVEEALDYMAEHYGYRPAGMWPAEGSVSDEALSVIAGTGIQWIATDEEILARTMGNNYRDTEKYFPRLYQRNGKKLKVLFRDHRLSDTIGFEYTSWDQEEAAWDFYRRLIAQRDKIVAQHGEEALAHAVIPIILDGENCWEFYSDNGLPFRRHLYAILRDSPDTETVTCSEATADIHSAYRPPINTIATGSWINSNFDIWIGHEDHRRAWSYLSDARNKYETLKNQLSVNKARLAFKHLMIAEGSDWFWWYGDSHQAPNKSDFDIMFRYHLSKAYEAMAHSIPKELSEPISSPEHSNQNRPQTAIGSPDIYSAFKPEEWSGSGVIKLRGLMSSMHQIGEAADSLLYTSDKDYIYLYLKPISNNREISSVLIECLSPIHFIIDSRASTESSHISVEAGSEDIVYKIGPKHIFADQNGNISLRLKLSVHSHKGVIKYPRESSLELVFSSAHSA